MAGGGEIKVYHSFTEHSREKVDNDSVFEDAVTSGLILSAWICQPGKPSPPLRVDTSSPVVAQHRNVPPSTTPPRMAPLTTPPSTSRVRSITPSSTPSSRRNQQRGSPASGSPSQVSSSPVSSGSARSTMGNRVKKRDGVCVFLGIVPLTRENHNCHILAASPSERRLDGDWYRSHRALMSNKGFGHLDQYVMGMEEYEETKARLDFQREEGGPSHIIALPCGGRENDDVQYATSLGLYAHQQFNEALGLGRVKLELQKKNRDANNRLDFRVSWSLAPHHHAHYFGGRGIQVGVDVQGKEIFEPVPHKGELIPPPTVDGQNQWPARLLFELYCEVWYPYQRWREDEYSY
jgi:hypothetical protein